MFYCCALSLCLLVLSLAIHLENYTVARTVLILAYLYLIIRVLFGYSYIDSACQHIWCRYGIVYQTTDVEMFICTRNTKHCPKGLITKVLYHFILLHLYIVRYTGTVTAATTQQPIPDTTTSTTTTTATTIRDSTAVFVTTTSPATATGNATYSATNISMWDLWIRSNQAKSE